ncbi:MAG: hypothetical protein IJ662_04230 [Clostridia bacterium]|nr:hypothetical protein [Clostridia bacterium]
MYDFYTTPRPANERTAPKSHAEGFNFDDEQPFAAQIPQDKPHTAQQHEKSALQTKTPPSEQAQPQEEQPDSPANIEIDNKYHIDTDKDISTDSGALRAPTPAADAACAPTGKVIEFHIPNPLTPERRKPIEKPKPFAFMDDDLFNRTDPETGEYVF